MTPRIIVDQDVVIPLRDGTRTRADIFRLDDDTPRPVVLQRSIYGKQGYMEHAYPGPMSIVRAGYVYISQDCRGCGTSDGYLDFFFQEQNDGYDTVEWAASQPWSNGRVGIVGNSALTMTALQAVAAQPPSLVAAFVVDGHTDMESWTKRAGVPSELYFAGQFMSHMVTLNNLPRLALDEDERAALLRSIKTAVAATRTDLLRLPVLDLEGLTDDHITSGLRSIFLAEPTDPFWKRDADSLGKEPTQAAVPIKAVSGAYSPFLASMARIWSARPDLGHELIIGPWGHYGTVGAPSGPHDYLDAPAGGRKAWWTAMTAWFDRWLKSDASESVPPTPSLHYFLTGENRWAATESWPPAGSDLKLYLSGSGEGSAAGELSISAPRSSGSTSYVYDPADPAPTIGGVLIDIGQVSRFDRTTPPDGAHDQRPLEARDDLAVYTSAPLTDTVRVVGPATANLWVSSSAEDTDFIVRLVDVAPDGYAAKLAEGIVRTRYRDGGNESWLTPGEPVEVEVDIDPIIHSVQAGHRIRVHVTSSSFPKFTRNLNTRAVPETGSESDIVVARQTVHHGPETASRLTLNVVPAAPAAWPYAAASARPAELDSNSGGRPKES